MKNQAHLFSIGEAASMCGVCVGTIRRWCRSGKLHETFRTFGNQRRFSFEDLKKIISPLTDNRITVGYARVSSYDQKSDLDAQIKRLSDYGCQLVIHDLGSGLNCKKPGLKKLLRLLWQRQVKRLVITHDDRLLRFGTPIVFQFCRFVGCDVVVSDEPKTQSFELELVKDVITLMTVFSARLYGKRSWKNKSRDNHKGEKTQYPLLLPS